MAPPLNHRPLREVVADEIRGLIVSGDLAPGERLIEDKLAERLGVSRNPVREAIRSLEATGLVEVIPRRGAYVADFNLADLQGMLEVRLVLDRWIAYAAAMHRDEDDIERLDECVREGREASKAGDNVRASQYHREFHLAIEAAAKNPYANIALEPLRERAEFVFSMLAENRGEVGWDEHETIRDAIAERDGERAETLIEAHLQGAIHELKTSFPDSHRL